MADSRICKARIGCGPNIGSTQAADERICKNLIGVGPTVPTPPQSIIYGSSGEVSYGSSGVIYY